MSFKQGLIQMLDFKSSAQSTRCTYQTGYKIFIIYSFFNCSSCQLNVNPKHFRDDISTVNTNFDNKLRHPSNYRDINPRLFCEKFDKDFYEDKIFFENIFNNIFKEFIPLGTPIKKGLSILENDAGAKCSTNLTNSFQEISNIDCSLIKEHVYGYSNLYFLKGWKLEEAHKVTINFKYLVTVKDNQIIDVSSKLLCGELYNIDTVSYQQSKIIKPLLGNKK